MLAFGLVLTVAALTTERQGVSPPLSPAVDIMSLVNHFARYLTMGALLLSLLLPAGLGQEPEEQDQPEFKIGVAVDQVFLSVTARARDGGFYKNLTREDFQVLEDGVVQSIINFTQEAVPVSVALLIDASGSTRYTQSSIRSAALRFAESLSPEDKIAIITFNDAPRLILDWSNDLDNIRYALETIWAKGPTVMNDALYVTFDDLLRDVEGKTAVMMLTDGVDTGSMVSMEDVTNLATRSDAIVYTASKLDQYWADARSMRQQYRAHGQLVPNQLTDSYILEARKGLQRLASLTGGRVLEAQAFSSLTEVYEMVAEELKNQYYLSYIPTNLRKDGGWRKLEVIPRRLGVVTKTRSGYYAPLDQPVDGSP